MLKILLLFILALTSNCGDIDRRMELMKEQIYNQIVQMINSQLTHLNTQFPANTKTYVSSFRSSGDIVLDKFSLSETDGKLRNKHNLPEAAIQKFKGIVFAEKVVFQSFSIIIDERQGFLDFIVAGAGREKDDVELAYLRLVVSATLIPPVTWVNHRSCKRRFFRKKCHDNWVAHPRGHNTDELLLIKNALQAEAFRALSEKIRDLVYNHDDVWFGQILSAILENVSKQLDEKAKLEFEDAINYVKKNKLDSIKKDIDAMLERMNHQIDELIKKSIETYKRTVKEVLELLTEKYLSIYNSVIYSKEYLLSYAADKVEALKKQIENDYAIVAGRVSEQVYKLNCAASSFETIIKNKYSDDLINNKDFDMNKETCKEEVSKTYFAGRMEDIEEDMTVSELYEMKKCILIKNISNKSQSDIKEAFVYTERTYQELVNLANEMKCYSTGLSSGANIKYYSKEMKLYSSAYSQYLYANSEKANQ